MSPSLRRALAAAFPGIVITAFDQQHYAHDAGLQWEVPLAVAAPRTEAEVVALVRWCARHDLPITARGAGSSIAGNALGSGLILDFRRALDRVLEHGPGWVRAQPGAVLQTLNRRLVRRGRRLGPSPSSEAFCTLGGMVGNNAAGSHGLRYGATVDSLLGVRFVTSDGEVHDWRGPRSAPKGPLQRGLADVAAGYASPWPEVAKNSSGYLLDRLGPLDRWHPQRILCASEGTLGVVTEVTLRTYPLPLAATTVLLTYDATEDALRSVPPLLALRPAAVELVDRAAVRVVRARHALPPVLEDAGCALVVDFFGARATLRLRTRALREEARGWPGLQAMTLAERPLDRVRLWAARRDVEPMLRALPGRRRPLPFIEDVTVPVEAQVAYVKALGRLLSQEGLHAPLYGHAGQGNLHVRPFLDPRRAEDRATLERVNERVARLAKRFGGTLTGEHGDGYLRTRFLQQLHPRAYRRFERVKRLFDPQDLMNPGKIVATRRREVAPRLYLAGPRYDPPPPVSRVAGQRAVARRP